MVFLVSTVFNVYEAVCGILGIIKPTRNTSSPVQGKSTESGAKGSDIFRMMRKEGEGL